jgi:hypothetical protein
MIRFGESDRVAVQTYVGAAETHWRRFDVYSLAARKTIALSRDGRWLVVLIGH